MTNNVYPRLILCFFMVITLAIALLFYGETGFNFSDGIILWQIRFPKIVVAFLAGGLLAMTGMLLQTFFQNPLAGPDLLGINAGASLGIALSIMGTSYLYPGVQFIATPLMAMLGAVTVFSILIFLLNRNMSRVTILIMGLLIASFASSLISVLINISQSLQVKNYFMWAMGTFQGVPYEELHHFVLLGLLATVSFFYFPKKLNMFGMGELYAQSMGLSVKKFKWQLILLSSFVICFITIYCGPIAFIGIIAPYLAKAYFKRSDARLTMPASFLFGSSLALLTEFTLIFFRDYSFSTNSLLGIFGAPVIGFYLYKSRRVL